MMAVGSLTDANAIGDFARRHSVDLVIIGPEAPLEAGVADQLWDFEIPCFGLRQALAQVETSKGFARDLMTKYHIPGLPVYKRFETLSGVESFLSELGNQYVVKFDGLMGGKGVRVSGDHLHSHTEAIEYCQSLLDRGGTFLIEEKLEGEEFSLMSLSDGEHLLHFPPVQDHKRALEGDRGPNTGGMGSYSMADGLLPFLQLKDVEAAKQINQDIIQALNQECGSKYVGVLYGGFMVTAGGIKLIEYNARLGDPEAMNVLAVLESDLLELVSAAIGGHLNQHQIKVQPKATVCKYAVPEGYPDNPVKGQPIDVSGVRKPENLYYASVNAEEGGQLLEAGSRTVAYVGIADTLKEAEEMAEKEISAVKGPLFHRKDIGTETLIQKRVAHMTRLRGT
jgi:phosphoribosylamine--glycine ligase